MVGKLKKTNLTRVSKTTNLYLVHLGKKPLTPHLFFSTLVGSGRNLYVLNYTTAYRPLYMCNVFLSWLVILVEVLPLEKAAEHHKVSY